MSEIGNHDKACTGVPDGMAPPLLLLKRPVVKAKPLARVGRKANGSLEDGRVASWAAQTVPLSVRRRHVERGPIRPQPGKSPRVLGPLRPRRHQRPRRSPFYHAVIPFRVRREREEGGSRLGSAGRIPEWVTVRQGPPGGDPERRRSSLCRQQGL